MRSSAARMQDEATTIAARTAGQIMHVPVLWTPGSYPGSIARRNGGQNKSQQLRQRKAPRGALQHRRDKKSSAASRSAAPASPLPSRLQPRRPMLEIPAMRGEICPRK